MKTQVRNHDRYRANISTISKDSDKLIEERDFQEEVGKSFRPLEYLNGALAISSVGVAAYFAMKGEPFPASVSAIGSIPFYVMHLKTKELIDRCSERAGIAQDVLDKLSFNLEK